MSEQRQRIIKFRDRLFEFRGSGRACFVAFEECICDPPYFMSLVVCMQNLLNQSGPTRVEPVLQHIGERLSGRPWLD
jgi:hypothetical protein